MSLRTIPREERLIKPLFAKGPTLGVRLLVLVVLSIALMVVDARFSVLRPVRDQMALVLMESYTLTDLPGRLWQGVASQFGSRTELVAENEKLKTEGLLLQGRLQKLAALTEQNVRLRELLNSSALVNEKVEVAELIGIDPNPFTHRILINKGERDGVVLGQPVLDARGLMGQVVELMPYTSRVLLLTDSTHSIPVQVNRNGLRAIASGTGNPERLELRHVADTADIKEGDLLVSSGLGQRFPAGYPVATVREVIHDSGQPFAIVRAVPTAAMNRSRYVLLVFTDSRTPEERAAQAAQAQEAADGHVPAAQSATTAAAVASGGPAPVHASGTPGPVPAPVTAGALIGASIGQAVVTPVPAAAPAGNRAASPVVRSTAPAAVAVPVPNAATPTTPARNATPATAPNAATPTAPVRKAIPATAPNAATPTAPARNAIPATAPNAATPTAPVRNATPATAPNAATPTAPVRNAIPATAPNAATPTAPARNATPTAQERE